MRQTVAVTGDLAMVAQVPDAESLRFLVPLPAADAASPGGQLAGLVISTGGTVLRGLASGGSCFTSHVLPSHPAAASLARAARARSLWHGQQSPSHAHTPAVASSLPAAALPHPSRQRRYRIRHGSAAPRRSRAARGRYPPRR